MTMPTLSGFVAQTAQADAGWLGPVLSFVGGVLGGGLIGAIVSARHETRENMRARQIAASERLLGAFDAAMEVLDDLRDVADEVTTQEGGVDEYVEQFAGDPEALKRYWAWRRPRRHRFATHVRERGLTEVWSELHADLEKRVEGAWLARSKITLLFSVRSGVVPRAELLVLHLRERQEMMQGSPHEVEWLETRAPLTDQPREDFVSACVDAIYGGSVFALSTWIRPRVRS
jgi:hypothetical protein